MIYPKHMLNRSSRIAFFTPLVALVNLFIYVLKFPTLPSTEADIALMSTAVDHFRRLGIASSDQTFRFASDATNLARAMTRKANDGETPGDGTPPLLGSLMEQAGIEHSLDGVHDVSFSDLDNLLLDVIIHLLIHFTV